MSRSYQKFADEAYIKNVVAFRCISIIAESAASTPYKLFSIKDGSKIELSNHPLLKLLNNPNITQNRFEFLKELYVNKILSGNAYALYDTNSNLTPNKLHNLKPDQVSVIGGVNSTPIGYRYNQTEEIFKDYYIDRLTYRCRIIHLKNHHPLDDYYGLSMVEAAANAIDQHNQAGSWNQSLLQNGARPSGALVVKDNNNNGTLTDEQYHRLKDQFAENYTGATNSGKPLLLEGGLEWKDMSLSPKDMDFVEAKNSAARDIALAFGVPPQVLGIPGDNKYNNYAEAKLSLWEQTIIPLVENTLQSLGGWLIPMFGDDSLVLEIDNNNISALAPKREKLWSRISAASFLTDVEKRELLGISSVVKN